MYTALYMCTQYSGTEYHLTLTLIFFTDCFLKKGINCYSPDENLIIHICQSGSFTNLINYLVFDLSLIIRVYFSKYFACA